jgi:c-di-GMP-binding flagellar brake protein YcgR
MNCDPLESANWPAGTAFSVSWPDEIQEVQRRAYQRATPPAGHAIAVRFWNSVTGPDGPQRRSGVMEDLSAGGLRVRTSEAYGLNEGDTVQVSFSVRSRGPAFVLDANFRHREQAPEGQWLLGFQFVGLESSRQGQQTLGELVKTVTGFQRQGVRTKSPRLISGQNG